MNKVFIGIVLICAVLTFVGCDFTMGDLVLTADLGETDSSPTEAYDPNNDPDSVYFDYPFDPQYSFDASETYCKMFITGRHFTRYPLNPTDLWRTYNLGDPWPTGLLEFEVIDDTTIFVVINMAEWVTYSHYTEVSYVADAHICLWIVIDPVDPKYNYTRADYGIDLCWILNIPE